MKMKFSRHILGILILVLLVGCLKYPDDQNKATQIANSQQEIKLPSPDVHISPTTMAMSPTQDPSNILTPLTRTLEVKKSPMPQSNKFHVQDHCPSVDVGIDQISGLPGTLVFSADNTLSKEILLSPKQGENSQVIFWHPQSDQISSYDLEESENQYYFAESPNKEKLAFMEGKQLPMALDLIVVNNRGEESGRIVVPDDWTFFNWLNNEQVLFRQYINEKDLINDAIYDPVLINIVDHQQQILSSDFPNISLSSIYWRWGTSIIYSPDSTLVFYWDNLWSVEENRSVFKMQRDVHWVRWSPDGNLLLLVANSDKNIFESHNELFLLTPAGEITRVSFFSEEYDEEIIIDSPVWAPDNRHIAFWFITDYLSELAKLAVLDTETLIVDLYCQDINPRPFRFGEDIYLGPQTGQINSTTPVWSPNSNFLLIEDFKDRQSNTLLVNTQDNIITVIAENARPVSWLK